MDAAAAERRPHRLPLRRVRRQLRVPAVVRPLCPRRQLQLLAVRQRQRAPHQRRAGPVVERPRHHRRASATKLQAGVLVTRYRGRFQDQVFDLAIDPSGTGVGLGNIDGTRDTLPSAGYTDANTNRDERSTEWYVRDAMRLGRAMAALGRTAPHPAAARERAHRVRPKTACARPDTTRARPALAGAGAANWRRERWSTPAGARAWRPRWRPTARATPTRGEALPALKSRQFEAGLKHGGETFDAALTLFDIDRPQAADIGACDGADSCTRAIDGSARHRGVEAQATHAQRRLGCGRPARCGSTPNGAVRRNPASTGSGRSTCPRRRCGWAPSTAWPPCPAWRCRPTWPPRATASCCPTTRACASRAGRDWTWARAGGRRIGADGAGLARGRGQRHRPPRLEGVPLPVRPRLLVPAGAAHLARVGAGIVLRAQRVQAILAGCIPR